ncbi:MAG TPA: deoxyribonuclease IV [Gemmatimonadales bacterium]|nr:deoxyribonuclease IV [Gemmatimonadales bacterium]
MTHYIGAHTIDSGGIDMAVRRAAGGGMTALQIFTAIPKFYGERTSVSKERLARFRGALSETGLAPKYVIAHAAYVLNTASGEELKWTRAAAGLAKELERSTALGLRGVCFHPGAATDGDREAALQRVALAMTQALDGVAGETKLYVENTAGAGNTVGRTPEEVAAILAGVPARFQDRIGYGLDTCHLHSAGHDITSGPAALRAVLDAFESATGRPPEFFHLNDSQFGQGTSKDRHALIGEGTIGTEPFGWLLHDRRSRNVPLILETPQATPEPAPDDPAPDPYDVRMVELLRGLAA